MTCNTITAAVGSVLVTAALVTSSYACDNTNPGMPMMDDPMEIVAAGSCNPDPDPPKDNPKLGAQVPANQNDNIQYNLYRDRGGFGTRLYGGQSKNKGL